MKNQRTIQRKLRDVEQYDLGPWPDEWRLHQRKGWADALRWVLKIEAPEKVVVHPPTFEQSGPAEIES